MSACAAATGPVRAPLGNSAFQAESFQSCLTRDCYRLGRARQIKLVLKRAGLTVSRASALTAMRYGKDTPYHVPPTFLYKIRNGITPHVCQLVALSQVTGCRFADWMNLCGFDLRLILALQLEVHSERTALITPAHPFSPHDFCFTHARLRVERSDRYFFVKVGTGDNVVYPKLLSGSVVRADRCYSPQVCTGERAEELLWLVEHPGGLACCHLKRIDNEHVVLLPNRPPLSAWPLRLSREARVLGLIDLELRPRRAQKFGCTYRPIKADTLATIPRGSDIMSLSTLLRISRARNGLTLRSAHQKTVRVAQLLQNADYRIPLGLLSDYEATDRFPRHIAKIISLCVVYGIDFWQLMRAGGSQIDDSGKAPLFGPDFSVPHDFGFGMYPYVPVVGSSPSISDNVCGC
jgi:hypothetical protein